MVVPLMRSLVVIVVFFVIGYGGMAYFQPDSSIDIISFVLGIALAAGISILIIISEKMTYSERIACACCDQAKFILDEKRRALRAENTDKEGIELSEFIDENLFPVENEDFIIDRPADDYMGSSDHMSHTVGVYSKRDDVWFLVEKIYSFESGRTTNLYYVSNSNWEKKSMIFPRSVEIKRYLPRD